MATESFYEDIVIDTPETKANFVSFMEEEPHVAVHVAKEIKHIDKASMDRLMQKHGQKNRHGRSQLPGSIPVRSLD